MAEIPKVHKEEFQNVIRALLKTPPMPLSDISPKKKGPNAKKRAGKSKRTR